LGGFLLYPCPVFAICPLFLVDIFVDSELEAAFFCFFPTDNLVEYDIPVPGTETLPLAPDLELIETPPRRPPKLIPALLFPKFSFTPFPSLTLFINRNPTQSPPTALKIQIHCKIPVSVPTDGHFHKILCDFKVFSQGKYIGASVCHCIIKSTLWN